MGWRVSTSCYRAALCCTVYKIPRLSEIRRMKAWILTFFPDWNQLFFEQRHHIYGVFLRGWMDLFFHSELLYSETATESIFLIFWLNRTIS